MGGRIDRACYMLIGPVARWIAARWDPVHAAGRVMAAYETRNERRNIERVAGAASRHQGSHCQKRGSAASRVGGPGSGLGAHISTAAA